MYVGARRRSMHVIGSGVHARRVVTLHGHIVSQPRKSWYSSTSTSRQRSEGEMDDGAEVSAIRLAGREDSGLAGRDCEHDNKTSLGT
jgi:hypothetical protein